VRSYGTTSPLTGLPHPKLLPLSSSPAYHPPTFVCFAVVHHRLPLHWTAFAPILSPRFAPPFYMVNVPGVLLVVFLWLWLLVCRDFLTSFSNVCSFFALLPTLRRFALVSHPFLCVPCPFALRSVLAFFIPHIVVLLCCCQLLDFLFCRDFLILSNLLTVNVLYFI
jgi:hypothetical protein